MPIELETSVPIPPSEECVAFSIGASVLFTEPDGFLRLQQVAADALIRSQVASGADCAALFCTRTGIGPDGNPGALITLMFVTDGDVHDLEALGEGIDGSGLEFQHDGVQEIPGSAFPSLAYVGGALHQVWISSPAGIAALSVGWREEGPIMVKQLLDDCDESDFLPSVTHAKVVPGDRKKQVHARKDRLKAAFSIRVCLEIMDSDGIRPDPEIAFFERTFNPRLLRSLDLDDTETPTVLQAEASVELVDLLEHEEKLGLIGLFYRCCQADGFVDERELKALRGAGADLGLSAEEIEECLRHL